MHDGRKRLKPRYYRDEEVCLEQNDSEFCQLRKGGIGVGVGIGTTRLMNVSGNIFLSTYCASRRCRPDSSTANQKR